MSGFWEAINEQCEAMRKARSADEVIDTLNRYGPASAGDAFFAGSGGDVQVDGCLREAGWGYVWFKAEYYWVMRAPDGSLLTYIEGDVYRGDTARRN